MMYGDFDINPRKAAEEPKHGFFQTGQTKGYGKRWKLKGMQRLRWYCQVCNKQCKDANGFKCHKTSRPHLEMMASAAALMTEEGEELIDHYSQEFAGAFLSVLKKKFGETRVLADAVYEAYLDDGAELPIQDTMWDSVPHFISYLVKDGRVLSDDTPEGPLIRYLPKAGGLEHWSTGLPDKKEKKEKKLIPPESDDVIKQRRIESMIKAAEQEGPASIPIQEATELKKDDNRVITFGFASNPGPAKPIQKAVKLMSDSENKEEEFGGDQERGRKDVKSRREDNEEEGRDRKRQKRDDYRDSRDEGRDRDTERDRHGGDRRDDRRDRGRDRDDRRYGDRDDRGRDRDYRRHGDSERATHRDRVDRDRERRDEQREPESDRRKETGRNKTDVIDRRHDKSPVPAVKTEILPAAKPVEKEIICDHWLTPGLIVKVMHKDLSGGKLYKRKGVVLETVNTYVGIIKMLDGAEEKLKIDQEFLETVIPAIGAPVMVVNGKFRGKRGTLESVNFDEFKAVVIVDGQKTTKEYEHICKIN